MIEEIINRIEAAEKAAAGRIEKAKQEAQARVFSAGQQIDQLKKEGRERREQATRATRQKIAGIQQEISKNSQVKTEEEIKELSFRASRNLEKAKQELLKRILA